MVSAMICVSAPLLRLRPNTSNPVDAGLNENTEPSPSGMSSAAST